MATHDLPIFGAATLPDSSGNVFIEPSSVKDTSDLFDRLVAVFNDTATRLGLRGEFRVPQNYVGSPQIVLRWKTTATTGQARWEFDYRAIATAESSDPSTTQESVGGNTTAPGTAHNYVDTTLTLTAGNFATNDTVQFGLFRDGAETAPNDDTIAAALVVALSSVVFRYSDA